MERRGVLHGLFLQKSLNGSYTGIDGAVYHQSGSLLQIILSCQVVMLGHIHDLVGNAGLVQQRLDDAAVGQVLVTNSRGFSFTGTATSSQQGFRAEVPETRG